MHLVGQLEVERVDERFLVGEVVVERAHAHSRFAADVFEAYRDRGLVGKTDEGRLEQSLAGVARVGRRTRPSTGAGGCHTEHSSSHTEESSVSCDGSHDLAGRHTSAALRADRARLRANPPRGSPPGAAHPPGAGWRPHGRQCRRRHRVLRAARPIRGPDRAERCDGRPAPARAGSGHPGRSGALPLRDQSVDAAMAILSLHHWARTRRAARGKCGGTIRP